MNQTNIYTFPKKYDVFDNMNTSCFIRQTQNPHKT